MPVPPSTAPRLELRVLGRVALERDGRPVEVAYLRGRALLAHLACAPDKWQRRQALAGLLWPDLDEAAALANLRQVLADLRRKLGDGAGSAALETTRDAVRLRRDGIAIDREDFVGFAPDCPGTPSPARCDPCLARLAALTGTYRDRFAADLDPDLSDDFAEWLDGQRENLHLRALRWLTRLTDCHEALDRARPALDYARRRCELAPDDEAALCRFMQLAARCGRPDWALERYAATAARLRRELGVEPAADTQVLARSLTPGPPAAPPAAPTAPPTARRQLTALAIELRADGDDPDRAVDALRGPRAACVALLRRAGAHLAPLPGGDVLAYFGYPGALENAPRLAADAASACLAHAAPGVTIGIGVHTGLAIDDGERPDASGQLSAVALRLGHAAPAGAALLSAATARLLQGYFRLDAAEPADARRLGPPTGAVTRLAAAADLSPFCGRERELAGLAAAWRDARAGRQRLLLLRGEAGIGKSRLILALREQLAAADAPRVLELQCQAEAVHTPYHPLIALLRAELGLHGELPAAAQYARLIAHVEAHYPRRDPDAAWLLGDLLDIAPERPELAAIAADSARRRTLDLLLDRLVQLAAEPLLLIVEDLHWADPSTMRLLRCLVADPRRPALLAVFTARPDCAPEWAANRVTTLALAPLPAAAATRLVASLAPATDAAGRQAIVARAEGVPLFAEELARQSAATGASASVPATLADLLAARLDRLGADKSLAQAAALIGRRLDGAVLAETLGIAPGQLDGALAPLLAARVLRRADARQLEFAHVLLRDAAESSLTRHDRAALHGRIADALAARRHASPEAIARHRAAAGDPLGAAGAWLRAGQRAAHLSALGEAIAHFTAALAALVAHGPDSRTRELEYEIQLGLGATHCASAGYASPEGEAAYTRAVALADLAPGRWSSGLQRALWGLWASASSRAGYAEARQLAERLSKAPTRGRVDDHQARFALANTLHWQGEFAPALALLDEVTVTYRAIDHAAHLTAYGEDVGVTANSYRSWVLFYLGRAGEARMTSESALTLARRHGHPFSLAYALVFAALLACRDTRPDAARQLAGEAVTLAERHDMALWRIAGAVIHGWAGALGGDTNGLATIRQCAETMRVAMGGVSLAVHEPLVQALHALGRHAEAANEAAAALATGAALGDHHLDAELLRLQGVSLIAGGATGGLACLETAVARAQAQGAHGFELAATLDLARYAPARRRTEMKQRLSEALSRVASDDSPLRRAAQAWLA